MLRRICFGVVLVFIFVACLWAAYQFAFDPKLYRRYESIRPTMTRQEVVRRMGQPAAEGMEFRLGQYKGYEKEYERARQTNSQYYLFWHSGIDITYAIGFDSEDKVTMKARGGT